VTIWQTNIEAVLRWVGGNCPKPQPCPQCDMKLFDGLKSSAYSCQKGAFRFLPNTPKCVTGHWGARDAPRILVGWGQHLSSYPHPSRRFGRLDLVGSILPIAPRYVPRIAQGCMYSTKCLSDVSCAIYSKRVDGAHLIVQASGRS